MLRAEQDGRECRRGQKRALTPQVSEDETPVDHFLGDSVDEYNSNEQGKPSGFEIRLHACGPSRERKKGPHRSTGGAGHEQCRSTRANKSNGTQGVVEPVTEEQ